MENADGPMENAIVEANLENDEPRIGHMLFASDIYFCSTMELYFLYPIITATTKILLLLKIPYGIRLCSALVLVYPLYRIIPSIVLVENRQLLGWRLELTHFWGWTYELYVLHIYSLFCLLMFLNLSFSTVMISLSSIGLLYGLLMEDLVQRPLAVRLKHQFVTLICAFTFFWWHDALTEGTVYELSKFHFIRWLGWLFFFICSICATGPAFERLL
ncbi:hypothetical protein Ddc_09682 [Ditylenchus destructor]|nr:hypothetical protein Ddc_09682 [Ditylenchus destructor]